MSGAISSDLNSFEPHEQSSTTSDIAFPDFSGYSGTSSETLRNAGRLVASQVSEEEHQALLRERQELLDKLFAKNISRHEQIRLDYVRWSLDRIDDAAHGADLDRIEATIDRYEHFLSELDDFKAVLNKVSKSRK